MTTLVPPTLPVLPRQGASRAPSLDCAQTSPSTTLSPPILHQSLVLIPSKELPTRHSALVVFRKTADNGDKQARADC